jgi:hypothetical protein
MHEDEEDDVEEDEDDGVAVVGRVVVVAVGVLVHEDVGEGVAGWDADVVGEGALVADVVTLGVPEPPKTATQSANQDWARLLSPSTPAVCRSRHHCPSSSGGSAGAASSTGAMGKDLGCWHAKAAPVIRTRAAATARPP